MKKFSYLRISRHRKLRYLTNNLKKNPFIVFLPGFMSDIEGKKPKSFLSFANKNKLGFLAIEYSGHGKSSGKFIDGNISLWTEDAKKLVKKIVKKSNCIYVETNSGSKIKTDILVNVSGPAKIYDVNKEDALIFSLKNISKSY